MKKIWFIIITIIIIISIIGIYYIVNSNSNDEYNNIGGYRDVYYFFSIETNNDSDYQLYIPIPTNVNYRDKPNPLVYELTKDGNISTSIVAIDSPMGKTLAMEINGSGNAKVEFNKRFYQNSSKEKELLREYQITNLFLLKDRDCMYIYFYSKNITTCKINFHTSYVNVFNDDDWQCYWKTKSVEEIYLGWNEIELIEYHDGDG